MPFVTWIAATAPEDGASNENVPTTCDGVSVVMTTEPVPPVFPVFHPGVPTLLTLACDPFDTDASSDVVPGPETLSTTIVMTYVVDAATIATDVAVGRDTMTLPIGLHDVPSSVARNVPLVTRFTVVPVDFEPPPHAAESESVRATNGRNERTGASMQLFRVSWQSPKVSRVTLRRNGHIAARDVALGPHPGGR